MTAKELIKKLMVEKDMPNADMAKSIGVSQATLWERLNPKKTDNMTVKKLNEMLQVLDYKVVIVPADTPLPEGGYQIE